MKIWIPYTPEGTGGTYTFVGLFSEYLQKRGHTIVYARPPVYDALLVIADCPLRYTLHAALTKKPIIQRLDGVYYPALPGLKGKLYWLRNLRLQIIHNWLARHIVYQSLFCQQACRLFLGEPRGDHSVIYNGITVPARARLDDRPARPVKLITFANFRRPDQILPLLAAVRRLDLEYQFDIIGPFTRQLAPLLASLSEMASVRYLGAKKHPEILDMLPQYDIMLFSDVSWCPNAVLEAQSAGLPVVAFERGGATELIANKQSGIVVPLASDNPLHTPHTFTDRDAQYMARAIETIADNLPAYSERAAQHVHRHFAFEQTGRQYEEILARYVH